MSNSIYAAPIYKLKELNNLFIELTEKNCNQRCAQCYINFPISRNTKDFISFEKIKERWLNFLEIILKGEEINE